MSIFFITIYFSFALKSRLNVHVRARHEQNYDYLCHICAKTCKSATALKYHLKAHAAPLKITCRLCGRFMATKAKWRKHMKRFHEQDKMHHCPACTKEFATADSLKHHIKYNHNSEVFQCNICGKLCQTRLDLTVSQLLTLQSEERNSYTFFHLLHRNIWQDTRKSTYIHAFTARGHLSIVRIESYTPNECTQTYYSPFVGRKLWIMRNRCAFQNKCAHRAEST